MQHVTFLGGKMRVFKALMGESTVFKKMLMVYNESFQILRGVNTPLPPPLDVYGWISPKKTIKDRRQCLI